MSRAPARRQTLHLVKPGQEISEAEAPSNPPAARRWGQLAAPVDPIETLLRMRAGSALFGFDFQDGTRYPDVLTIEQARDVLAWYSPRLT